MPRILGLETEYGLYIEGRGAADQVEDARAFVAGSGNGRPGLWDYRHESPRADLRGFDVNQLTIDPEDAKFDQGRTHGPSHEVRADRIQPDGARFYNDHGHPEYATPECFDADSLALADAEGNRVLLEAARRYEAATGRQTRVYKNNTDFHGASYGTHESYLVRRCLHFERLYRAVVPMLVARQILCGAGKVGREHGADCAYQISQRADFFTERASVDTLYRRPVFNTRDEPHASEREWIRLHVIAGDANMMPACTRRKVALVRLAVALEELDAAPRWDLADPVRAFESVSKDAGHRFEFPLAGRSWTTAYDIVDSYLAAAEAHAQDLRSTGFGDGLAIVGECRFLLDALRSNPADAAPHIDWLAKRAMLTQIIEAEGFDWRSPELRSFDLEYHNIDPDVGLYFALESMGQVAPLSTFGGAPSQQPRSRSYIRGLATAYPELVHANWRSLTFDLAGQIRTIELKPDVDYAHVVATPDVVSFIRSIESR